MRNPRFGYGAIGQTSQVNTVNLGLPIRGTDAARGASRERPMQTENLFYPAQFRVDNVSGKTLKQLQNTRPLTV